MICSSVPTSRSRTIAKAVRLTMMTSVSVPMTPGTKNQRPFRVRDCTRVFARRLPGPAASLATPWVRCVEIGGVILGKSRCDRVHITERDQRRIRVGAVDDHLERRALPLAQQLGEAGVDDERDGGIARYRSRR